MILFQKSLRTPDFKGIYKGHLVEIMRKIKKIIFNISREQDDFIKAIKNRKVLFSKKEIKEITKKDLERIKKTIEFLEDKLNKKYLNKESISRIYVFCNNIKKLYSIK